MEKFYFIKRQNTRKGYLLIAPKGKGKKAMSVLSPIPFPIKTSIMLDVTDNGGRGSYLENYDFERNDYNERAIVGEYGSDKAELFWSALEIYKVADIPWKTAYTIAESGDVYASLGFKRGDKIAKKLGEDSMSPNRIKAINDEVKSRIRQSREKKVSVNEYVKKFEEVEELGAFEPFDLQTTIRLIGGNSDYEIQRDSNGKLIDVEVKRKEEWIRDSLRQRMSDERSFLTLADIEKGLEKNKHLDEEQKACLYCLQNTNPTLITGKAGTGKTTVIKAIVECYSNKRSVDNICLLAPTAKASQRMTESCGIEAYTIHSGIRKGEDFCYYNKTNTLPFTLIIIDECSMVDSLLMYDLLNAIDESAKIIFMGDHRQLEPVGIGEPFFDFEKDKLCDIYYLNHNHRQNGEGSTVLKNADDVLLGRFGKKYDFTESDTVKVFHINREDIKNYVSDDTRTYIAPYNEVCDEINELFRKPHKEDEYGIGDKVIGTHNEADYCNGSMGVIKSITSEGYEILFTVESKLVTVPFDKADTITLAYCLTVHKMQGSDDKSIDLFLPEKRTGFISDKLLYTAITRSKELLNIYLYK